ncbi:alginate lyase family protein [Bacillus sp. NTK074B]|uniref:alginate lyase family protein n=1 Tax=Bacillus sp. NTK074B TaxID=2802174 RepID=UPI001A8DEFBD|nr:alginate lyase family protein [Bacillus sp. NTK074B]
MLGLRNKVIMFIVLMVGISLFSTGTGNSGKAASYNPFTLTITKATYLYMKPGGELVRYKYAGVGRTFDEPLKRSGDYFVIRPYSTSYYIPVSDVRLDTKSVYMDTLTSSNFDRLIQEFFTESQKGSHPYVYNKYAENDVIKYADSALKGEWKLLAHPYELAVNDLDTFDWRRQLPSNNSFLFQLNYLMVVEQLTQAYRINGNPDYLAYARDIIEDWHEDFPIEGYRSYKWGYNDHGTAIRTFILIDFWMTYKESPLNDLYHSEFSNELMTMFYEHGWLLNMWSFYRPNNNHGMFQDLALLAIAETFPEMSPSKEWKNTATSRLIDQIDHGISKNGLHMEHSPMYQHYIYTSLVGFLDWAEDNNFSLPSEMIRRVRLMPENLTYLTKPNGVLPIFGDSPASPMSVGIVPYSEDYPEMTYSMTGGQSGSVPKERSVNLSDQYAIFRQHWGENQPFKDSVFFGMTAGYHSTAHKQPDDLSIDLYGFGGDYIVETGRYAYFASEERRTAMSTGAHNIVQVEGSEFSLSSDNIGKSGIEEVTTNSDGTMEAVGSHQLIPGVTHRRRVLYDQEKTFLISDTLKGTYTRNFLQKFHLAPEFTVKKDDVRMTVAEHPSGRTLSMVQVYAPSLITESVGTSHVSYRDYTWTERPELTYAQENRSVRFMTLIHLGENPVDTIEDVDFERVDDQYVIHYKIAGEKDVQTFTFTADW